MKSINEMSINEDREEQTASGDDEDDGSSADEGEEEDDDDEGWITATNIKEKRREIEGGTGEKEEQKHVKVACMTTDFAMQGRKNNGLNSYHIMVDDLLPWINNNMAATSTHISSTQVRYIFEKCLLI